MLNLRPPARYKIIRKGHSKYAYKNDCSNISLFPVLELLRIQIIESHEQTSAKKI